MTSGEATEAFAESSLGSNPGAEPTPMDSGDSRDLKSMELSRLQRVVHLELHTGDLPRASAFYSGLLRWRVEEIETGYGSYLALEFGGGFGGGIVECGTLRPLWLPYIEVERVDTITERASELGATVLLEPREGPAGWRSVVTTTEGGDIAFWQPKGRSRLGGHRA
jgi:predicted enzyme related to lactoylglutathione lyase